MLGLPD